MTERVWQTGEKKYVRLLPVAMGVRPRGHSRRLDRALTDFGCEHSFAHAAARVLEHYGFEISASAVREATLTHARQAARRLEQRYQEPFQCAGDTAIQPIGPMSWTHPRALQLGLPIDRA